MDDDRQDLVDVQNELNTLLERVNNSVWKAEVKEEATQALLDASAALYRMRLRVGAVEDE